MLFWIFLKSSSSSAVRIQVGSKPWKILDKRFLRKNMTIWRDSQHTLSASVFYNFNRCRVQMFHCTVLQRSNIFHKIRKICHSSRDAYCIFVGRWPPNGFSTTQFCKRYKTIGALLMRPSLVEVCHGLSRHRSLLNTIHEKQSSYHIFSRWKCFPANDYLRNMTTRLSEVR